MSLKRTSSEDFSQLLSSLAWDLQQANYRFAMLCGLLEQVGPYEREMNQARTFWSVTLESLRDAVLFRLCRIYDQTCRDDTLHLLNWLQEVKGNMELFDTQNLRQRLQGNRFVDSLAATARRPDAAQLERDLEFASKKSNPLVQKLYDLRCKVLAHRDRDSTIRGRQWLEASSPNYEDIKTLLVKGLEILNRYSMLFKATEYSRVLWGADDYLWVLKDIREAHANRDGIIDEQIRQDRAKQAMANKEE